MDIEFYIAVAVHRSQQQLVVRNNPPVVDLLIHSSTSYPHANNATYLSTIIRVTPPIQWVAIRAGRFCNFSARYYRIEKNRDITIYRGFYKSLWIDCSIRKFRFFIDLALQVPGFCLQ